MKALLLFVLSIIVISHLSFACSNNTETAVLLNTLRSANQKIKTLIGDVYDLQMTNNSTSKELAILKDKYVSLRELSNILLFVIVLVMIMLTIVFVRYGRGV